MSDVAVGKLLPNLKITLGNDSDKELMEDGELSDTADTPDIDAVNEIPKKNVDIVRSWMNTLQNPKVYENKNGGFVTGLDLSSEVLMKKLGERAERFGLEKKEVKQITQNEIDALYKSLGIDRENLNSCKLKNIRLDALHMRGVEEMSTSEIFKYFGDYGPASVEWINDFSCNVVWLDEATTARALLGTSQPLAVEKKDDQDSSDKVLEEKQISVCEAAIENSDSEEMESGRRITESKTDTVMDVDMPLDEGDQEDDESIRKATNLDVPVPPGHWRVGVSHPKAKAILLRFSTKDDKKIRGAEKRSQYYQKYGNPNYGGMKGIISTSKKRKLQAAKNKEMMGKLVDNLSSNAADTEGDSGLFSSSIAARHNRVKMPRMKMYADDEEKKQSSKFRRLEVESKPGSIHSRLGKKYSKDELFHLGSKFSSGSDEEEPDDNVAINCTVPSSRFDIWTDIAKSMAREDDRDFNEPKYRRRRPSPPRRWTERPCSFRTSSPNFKSKRYSKSPPRSRTSLDLRSVLSSSRSGKRQEGGQQRRLQEDLRSKINRIKDEESGTKHRSPLCVDD